MENIEYFINEQKLSQEGINQDEKIIKKYITMMIPAKTFSNNQQLQFNQLIMICNLS